ncbi:unnamed protein product [Moneuplotes crassus]|uniref:PB1 domain-containing protein n=1 Tax=Euplotes crassus TaxID=5936 RepID=A0AAD1X1P4_EUPCR|nr:unnamed protein product [Moneuplotes crassus]
MEFKLGNLICTNPVLSNVVNNLAEIAGVRTQDITVPVGLTVKIKYKNKVKVLSRNPKDLHELKSSVFKCFPDLQHSLDLTIHYVDDERDKSFLNDTNDLLAAYKLMNMLKHKKVLQFVINSPSYERSVNQNMGLLSTGETSIYKPVGAKRMKIKIMNWRILENALLIRNGYIYEFSKSNKNCYGYRCADTKNGCLGKWNIYERDVAGYGLEHCAHTLPKKYHKSLKVDRDIARTALNIVPFLDMKGDLPYIVTYDQCKKVVMRLLEKDLRLSKDDLINCFLSLGTDWNLLSKHLMDNLILKMRSRLAVKINDKNDLEEMKSFDGQRLGRKLLELKVDEVKQYVLYLYSPTQEEVLRTSPTLFLNCSYKQILKPQWKDVVMIHCFVDGLCVTVGCLLFQSCTASIFKEAFDYLIKELNLQTEELILDLDPDLVEGATQVFSADARFKTCAYFIFKYLTERANRLGLYNQGIDIHVNRLLKCLKSLVFKPKDEVEGYFSKIKDYFKKYCSTFHLLFTEFENVFLQKYNIEYWSCHYLIFEENLEPEAAKEAQEKRDVYLKLNKKLEINDKQCIEKCFAAFEEKTQSGFAQGIANIERMSRTIISNQDTPMQKEDNPADAIFTSNVIKENEDVTCKNAQIYGCSVHEIPEYSILSDLLLHNKDLIEEELAKQFVFPTEIS